MKKMSKGERQGDKRNSEKFFSITPYFNSYTLALLPSFFSWTFTSYYSISKTLLKLTKLKQLTKLKLPFFHSSLFPTHPTYVDGFFHLFLRLTISCIMTDSITIITFVGVTIIRIVTIFFTFITLDVGIISLIASSSTPICLARLSLLLIIFFISAVLTTLTILASSSTSTLNILRVEYLFIFY